MKMLCSGKPDGYAHGRMILVDFAARFLGSPMLEDRFFAGNPSLPVAKRRARLAYLSAFIEQAKYLGFVQQFIDRGLYHDVKIAT